ncbi:MAG: DUF5678 domain-containing protein [Candidatus Geothermarchaeales archaeon]
MTEGMEMMEGEEPLEVIEERMKALQEDAAWLAEFYENSRRKEGTVIAVKDKKIIESSDNLEELLEKLRARKENPALLLIDTAPPKGKTFIL